MIRWFKEWQRKRKEKLFREYEAWKHAQNQPKPGPSYNCRCYTTPAMAFTAGNAEAPESRVRLNHMFIKSEEEIYDPNGQLKCLLKTKRRVERNKKLTAGKHGKINKTKQGK